tara:strand:+ start:3509 stop:5719 length:2211 start_codon:yes stop_codon:yes gene_type:complete
VTNLSELLPSGGGAKEFSAVASGTLLSGQTVALKADGTVNSISTTTAQAGTMFEVTTAAVVGPSPRSVYATNADRMVIVYSLSGTLYYKLGEVSSFGITLGSQTAIPTISTTTNQTAICYDEANERVVVFFKDSNNSDHGTAIAGTVSTSGITWGTAAVFNNTNTNYITATTGGGKVCVVFTSYSGGTFGTARLGTITGNNITFPGSSTNFLAGNGNSYGLVYSEDQGNFVVFYNQETTSAASTPLNISGNNITLGSEVQFNTQRTDYITAAYDKTKNKTLITYLDGSTAYKAIVGTNSGSAMSFGTEENANFGSAADDGNVVYDPHAQQCVIVFGNAARNNELTFRPVTITGTTITFVGSITHVNIGVNGSYYYSLSAYTSQNKLVTTFFGASSHADGVVYQSAGSNLSSFIGITGQAISDTATGKVNPQGGVATTQLPISAVYNSQSFSTASQDALPEEVRFKPDGTKFYILGATNDAVYQYSMSTAWDVSTASYESKSFSVQTQDTNPQGLAINADGTSFYMCGQSMSIYQYDLTTAYDASTASYASKSFSFSGQISGGVPWGIDFDSTGTKLYVIGSPGIAYQYTLSTAFDVSTASYASKSLDTTSQTSDSTSLALSSDGASLYVMSNGNDTVFKYTLSTPNDLATASYSGFSFTTTSQDTTPYGVAIKTDETQVYITGAQNDSVYQYSLSTSLTPNTVYYVQGDGSLSTTSSTVTAGKAISTTQLLLNGAS